MQIVQHPSHTRRAALRALGGITAITIGGATAGSIAVSHSRFLLAGCAYFITFQLVVHGISAARRYVAGYRGERRTLAALRGLSDDYTAITNFRLPGAMHGDIDLALAGPMGLLVVEIKAYRGTILYERGAWWRVGSNGDRMPLMNVSAQVRTNARDAVMLIQRARTHSSTLHGVFVPIAPVLVFAGSARLNMVNPDMTVLKADDLAGYVRQLPHRLDRAQTAALVALFACRPA